LGSFIIRSDCKISLADILVDLKYFSELAEYRISLKWVPIYQIAVNEAYYFNSGIMVITKLKF